MSTRPFAATRLLPIVACAFLAACSDDDNDDARGPTGERPMEGGVSSLSIAPCEDDPMLDCGTLDVPLIHDSTDQRRMLVDVVVLPGTGAGPHEPLLVNPGGPGGPGTGAVRVFAANDLLPAALRERYDFVGFDPRGVGASQRIDCGQSLLDDPYFYPQDRTELEAFAISSTAFADDCFAKYGDVLQHLGSNAVVQDMEALRELLDAPKMHFLGYSYGTRLAALYLERHPDTSGRMVLDGNVLPGSELAPLSVGQNLARQRNLDALLAVCGTTLPDCDPTELDGVFGSGLWQAIEMEDEPVRNALFALLTVSVDDPSAGAMIIPSLIDYALTGNSEPAIALARENGLIADSSPASTADEAGDEAGDDGPGSAVAIAVLCADDPARPTVDGLITALAGLNEASDLFAELNVANAGSCLGWPASIDPVLPIATSAAPASLVIGGRTDTATPFEFAPVMADAIGGVFLASDHDGHTSVFLEKSRCVDGIALAFLLDGTLPPAGTSCPADAGGE